MSKLDDTQIKEIKNAPAIVTNAELAQKFGVSEPTISYHRNKKKTETEDEDDEDEDKKDDEDEFGLIIETDEELQFLTNLDKKTTDDLEATVRDFAKEGVKVTKVKILKA